MLVETRDLPFRSDVHRVDSLAQLAVELPARLALGARVLKQHRGHSGIGVWRVERAAGNASGLNVHRAQRGSEAERLDQPQRLERLALYFESANGGRMIDQAWQPRLAEGMVRACLVEVRVGGFGHQAINALHPDVRSPARAATTGRRTHASSSCDTGWSRAGLRNCANASACRANGCVLCETNGSSVSPFPPSAIDPLVAAVRAWLAAAGH